MSEEKLYILIRHDPSGHNLSYLFPHSQVVETLESPTGDDGVDIVEVSLSVPWSDPYKPSDLVELAEAQLSFLKRGKEARYPFLITNLEDARKRAKSIDRFLVSHLKDEY